MKMVSNLLGGIEGIQVFYIIGLLIFLTMFIVIFIRTMKRSDSEVRDIKESILVENSSEDQMDNI